ncbi:hypothetical protein [Nonomuraea sp. NPDC049695]|uniref:hypothetical protein n=1 Tax=Nonomuraea sp. NPDC049695 TaxID=3154734 RepID=UPI003414ABCD
MDGTYQVVADPAGIYTGSASAQVNIVAQDVAAQAAIGGAASTLTTTIAGQHGVWTFTATAGQQVSFNFTGSTFTSSSDVKVKVKKPDGTDLVADTRCGANCLLEPTVLPVDGTYTVELSPQNAKTGSLTLQLYSVAHLTGTVAVGGAASSLTTTTPGQNGSWSFSGTAGQLVSFNFTDANFASSTGARVSVKKPDGSVFVAATYCGRNCFLEPVALPVSGTYRVEFDPQDGNVGKLTARLYSVAHLTGSVAVGGAASSLTTTTPGQNGTWSFSGTAGQFVSFNFTDANFTLTTGAQVTVKKPDGTTLIAGTYCGRNCFLDPVTLPATGTYTVEFNPREEQVGKLTLQAYSVTDLSPASIVIGGATSTLTTKTPGQNGTWTFNGTANQKVTFAFTNASFASSIDARVSVTKPDGTALVSPTYCGRNCTISATTLPTTGTYTILFNPQSEKTGSLTVKVALGG